MEGLLLGRPGPQHLDLLAEQIFMGVDHPPFESREEMIRITRDVNDEVLTLSLFIVKDRVIIGVVRVGLYNEKPAILQFSLNPPYDAQDVALPILRYTIEKLLHTHPGLTYAIYEERFRPLFEAFGCTTVYAVKHVIAPIVKKPIETTLVYRLATPDDTAGLSRLIGAAYSLDETTSNALAAKLFLSSYSTVASFVGERDNGQGLAAASMVLGRQGQQRPTLEHAMAHPDEQRKGWATTLVQASMNVLADMGCTHFVGLATTNNFQVPGLHRRVGFVQDKSVIYAGTLPGVSE